MSSSKVQQGSALVELSALLVRGGWNEQVESLFLRTLAENEEDTIVLAFHTRSIRGGKGERKLFMNMMRLLLRHNCQLMIGLLDLIPEYGCWRDLYDDCFKIAVGNKVVDIVAEQLLDDAVKKRNDRAFSLCAKWAPREGKDTPMAKRLAMRIFPEEHSLSHRLKSYRKLVADLNRSLDTTEIKMCDGHFADIQPEKVPGLCLEKHMKAFLNEPLGNTYGIRHPDNKDRMDCREHFQEHLAKVPPPFKEERVQTSIEALRLQLDDVRYEPIRKRLANLYLVLHND